MVDINRGAVIWQPPLLTSGQLSSVSGTQYKVHDYNLIHILQISALYWNTGLSNCMDKTYFDIVLLVGTFGV